ncbi:predicted protein [Botrytis cinerea T4]|uniref:Uncharacterized protein n=1 Tax=Botryotinia fuckeliana (strain T4) TaxID=999810 RepID=G2YAQ1_BOTF4|nr:predicted protein [Botrytis cinerea T4]
MSPPISHHQCWHWCRSHGLNLTKTVQEKNLCFLKNDFLVSPYCGSDLVKYPQQHSDLFGFVLQGSYLSFDFHNSGGDPLFPRAHSTSSGQDRISNLFLYQRQRSNMDLGIDTSTLLSLLFRFLLLLISNR